MNFLCMDQIPTLLVPSDPALFSDSFSLGKRFRDLKYFFEMYPGGSLVWPANPF
jgi:hypothetical protein